MSLCADMHTSDVGDTMENDALILLEAFNADRARDLPRGALGFWAEPPKRPEGRISQMRTGLGIRGL